MPDLNSAHVDRDDEIDGTDLVVSDEIEPGPDDDRDHGERPGSPPVDAVG